MKQIPVTLLIFFVSLGPAFSDGLNPIALDSAPAVMHDNAPVSDWSGIYGGISYGRSTSDWYYNESDGDSDDVDYVPDTANGAFLGYNFQRNKLVLGAEVNYLANSLELDADGDIFLRPLYELRGRAGYSIGRFLLYGFAGYSRAKWEFVDVTDGNFAMNLDGFSLGAGVDIKFTDRVFVGLDYARRDLAGTLYDPANAGWYNKFENPVETVGVRAGLKF
jgi:outer membrane immunogenic protein